jgi:hypothetical protein
VDEMSEGGGGGGVTTLWSEERRRLISDEAVPVFRLRSERKAPPPPHLFKTLKGYYYFWVLLVWDMFGGGTVVDEFNVVKLANVTLFRLGRHRKGTDVLAVLFCSSQFFFADCGVTVCLSDVTNWEENSL